jgi:hypothetical protein
MLHSNSRGLPPPFPVSILFASLAALCKDESLYGILTAIVTDVTFAVSARVSRLLAYMYLHCLHALLPDTANVLQSQPVTLPCLELYMSV